jgi:O-antigen ligase
VRRVLGETGVWALTLAVLLGLLLTGTASPTAGVFAVGLAAGIAVLVCLGSARTGTLLVTIAMFLAPLNDLRLGTSYVTVSDVAFVLGFAVLTPTVLHNRIKIPALFLLGLAILLTMGAIASAAAPIPIVSMSQLVRLLVGAFVLPIFFMIWRPPVPSIVRFAGSYIFGSVFSVGYGLVQGPVDGDARYAGYTYHPNYLGLACLLAVSLVPYVTAKIAPQHRWIFWTAGLVNAYGVWISGSRAALLVLIMLIFVYPFVERSIKAVGMVMLGVAGALAFSGTLLQEDGNSALGRLFGNGTATGSDIERRNILSAAWEQFQAHPLLGNGFDGGIGSHNIYLQVAVAVGIFGLLGYLFIIWTALRPLFWEGAGHRLAYPVLAYAAIGPLTNTLWERLIWAVLALSFVGDARPPGHSDVEAAPSGALVKEGT